jgi:hypothetical protein
MEEHSLGTINILNPSPRFYQLEPILSLLELPSKVFQRDCFAPLSSNRSESRLGH